MMIYVPIASHRLMGRVQLHKTQIEAYKQRIEEAQKKGNFLQGNTSLHKKHPSGPVLFF